MSNGPDSLVSSKLSDEESKIDALSVQALEQIGKSPDIPIDVEDLAKVSEEDTGNFFKFRIWHADLINALTALNLPKNKYNQYLTVSVHDNECLFSVKRNDVVCQIKVKSQSESKGLRAFTTDYYQFAALFSNRIPVSQDIPPNRTKGKRTWNVPADLVDLAYWQDKSLLQIQMRPSKDGKPKTFIQITTMPYQVVPVLFSTIDAAPDNLIIACELEAGIRRTAIASPGSIKAPLAKHVWVGKDRMYTTASDFAALFKSNTNVTPQPLAIPVKSRDILCRVLRRFSKPAQLGLQDNAAIIHNDVLACMFPSSDLEHPNFDRHFESSPAHKHSVLIDRQTLMDDMLRCCSVIDPADPVTLILCSNNGDDDEPFHRRSHEKILDLISKTKQQCAHPITAEASLVIFARDKLASATISVDVVSASEQIYPIVVKLPSGKLLKAAVACLADKLMLEFHDNHLTIVSAEDTAEYRFLVAYHQ